MYKDRGRGLEEEGLLSLMSTSVVHIQYICVYKNAKLNISCSLRYVPR